MNAGIETLRALSIHNPWAWALCIGLKDVENRDWATRHRGPLLIHAGRTYDADAEGFIEGASGVAVPRTQSAGPAGALIGAARLVECVTSHPGPWFFGRYGFVLEDPILFGRPIRCRGLPGVFAPALDAAGWRRLEEKLSAHRWAWREGPAR